MHFTTQVFGRTLFVHVPLLGYTEAKAALAIGVCVVCCAAVGAAFVRHRSLRATGLTVLGLALTFATVNTKGVLERAVTVLGVGPHNTLNGDECVEDFIYWGGGQTRKTQTGELPS